jgi:transcription factor TFIIIB component B''
MTGKDFSGPVPEIRAPQQVQPAVAAVDEQVEDTQDAAAMGGSTRQVKKKNHSQSRGINDGDMTVIGDIDDLQTP